MHDLLTEIIAEKKKEVRRLSYKKGDIAKEKPPFPIRDFRSAISGPGRINLIAEIKFASPSAGIIHRKADPLKIGRIYEEAGAAAISFLTDKRFFRGDINHLLRLKRGISLPILRKDFIIHESQVIESFLYGADAILLIVRILAEGQFKMLLDTCQKLGMAALSEVHDRDDLEMAIECGADIIGINNRDLDTFKVSLNTTLKLAPLVPYEHVLVSESGVKNREDIQCLKKAGIQAVLVGTGLMKSEDMGKGVRDLVEAGENHKS